MKKVMQSKDKVTLLLVAAIFILCTAFIFSACGNGPAQKAVNTILGNFALDFTDCPGTDDCIAVFTTAGFDPSLIGTDDLPGRVPPAYPGKPLTFEAWVKPTDTSTGTILTRFSVARGAKLHASSTATMLNPQFSIRRVVSSPSGVTGPDYTVPTSTVTYTVDSLTAIALNAWTHVAGILSDDDHTTVHAACTDATGAESDPWHLDIYVAGSYSDCTETYGGTTAAGDPDPTIAAVAYAHEPDDHVSGPGKLKGLIDEARVWNVDRTAAELVACDGQELAFELMVAGESCDIGSENLITYHTFNRGTGHTVDDRSGTLGGGGKEYPDPVNPGEFLDWNTGWSTDTPFDW